MASQIQKQAEIRARGRVQGVGYRYFVLNKAQDNNIRGYVKNEMNGDVFVMAQGDEKDIKTLIDWMHAGPPLSRVEKITVNWFEKSDSFKTFTVKF